MAQKTFRPDRKSIYHTTNIKLVNNHDMPLKIDYLFSIFDKFKLYLSLIE